MDISSIDQLRTIYDQPRGRAKDKVLTQLEKHSIHFIRTSPFFILSTYDKKGRVDTSPRGGERGFVKVLNNKEIVFHDAKGNNRLDSLINIIETGNVATLFLIPGVDETLRVNGRARITTDENYVKLFSNEKNPPKTCIIIKVEEVFLHCAKAFMRSKLWDEEIKMNRKEFPTMGKMLNDQLKIEGKEESMEEMKKRYEKDL